MTDHIRARSSKAMNRRLVVALLLVTAAVGGYLGRTEILRRYDAVRLTQFSREIEKADRIVATWEGSAVVLEFAGEEVKEIVRAASSGVSARMPKSDFMCAYSAVATYYSEDLFVVGSKGPPFVDRSGVVLATIYSPLREALRE